MADKGSMSAHAQLHSIEYIAHGLVEVTGLDRVSRNDDHIRQRYVHAGCPGVFLDSRYDRRPHEVGIWNRFGGEPLMQTACKCGLEAIIST